MNAIDKDILDRRLTDAKAQIYNQAEKSLIELQEGAYNAGLERGQGNINRVIRVLETVMKAIDDDIAGNGTKTERINGIDNAYLELETLYKELQQ